MDAGVHLPLIDFGGEGFSHRRLTETVNAARECGFAAVSANDHFLFSVPWLDGLTALAAVAHQSGEMKLMTSVALVTLRGPTALAKALSALDILSGGRVIAGLGPGSSRGDYAAAGLPFEQRWQRFDAAVRLIKGMLQPGPAGGAPAGGLLPPPRQSRGIPLWIGSWAHEPACAAWPVLVMAGLPRRTTPHLRGSPRTSRSSTVSSNDNNGGPVISRTRWSRCGRGSLAAGQMPNASYPGSLLRWSGGIPRSFAAGSASARRSSARSCCRAMPARAASGSSSGRWVMSGARLS